MMGERVLNYILYQFYHFEGIELDANVLDDITFLTKGVIHFNYLAKFLHGYVTTSASFSAFFRRPTVMSQVDSKEMDDPNPPLDPTHW